MRANPNARNLNAADLGATVRCCGEILFRLEPGLKVVARRSPECEEIRRAKCERCGSVVSVPLASEAARV